jgi:NADH:ubiquinone oxidoreductase subunit F (NADH-binding)
MTIGAEAVRLLAGADSGRPMSLDEHLLRHGLPSREARTPEALMETVASSGLRGHGGADFPTATKMRAVAASGRPAIVVANGAEGEPLSAKDRVLLAAVPHLVLDGAALAAEAVGAKEAIVCVSVAAEEAVAGVRRALGERAERGLDRVPIRGVTVPNVFLAGEESALVHLLNGGPAKPTFVPPRPFQRGVRGRPTLVQNVETLAHLALIARYGADWFRELGTEADPGSALVTLCGAFRRPGVCEIACETPLRDIVALAGGPAEPLQAFLIGGYFGSWFSAHHALDLRLGHSRMREAGGSLGSGVIAALPESACGLRESARVLGYMAEESSGQCGPCVHGLRSIADGVAEMAQGRAARDTHARVVRWSDDVVGRGACHHPDGAVRFLRSALSVFAGEVARHERGGACSSPSGRDVLSVPVPEAVA